MSCNKPDYECVRCGYKTKYKNNIRRHLFTTKKVCPALKNNIDLTDLIKDHILANRYYNIPPTENTTTNIINNYTTYNQINNIVSNMNPLDKLTKYLEYKNLNTKNFEDMIEDRYEREIHRFENDSYRYPMQFKKNDFYNIVDDLTLLSQSNLDNLNTFYDEKSNRLHLYSDGEWTSYWIENGINEIIEKIKTYYLDTYEVYLIRKITKDDQIDLHKRLQEYYHFLACFELNPFVYGRNDTEILYNMDDDRNDSSISSHCIEHHVIVDKYKKVYNDIKDDLKVIDLNKMRKNIKDIIKNNTKINLSDLNKQVMDLLQLEEEFKLELCNKLL